MARKFICEDELDKRDIAAAMREGDLRFWRRDADGRTWFKATEGAGVIRGIPKANAFEAIEPDDEIDASLCDLTDSELDDDILAMSDSELEDE